MSNHNSGDEGGPKDLKPYESPKLELLEIDEIPNVYAIDGGGGY